MHGPSQRTILAFLRFGVAAALAAAALIVSVTGAH